MASLASLAGATSVDQFERSAQLVLSEFEERSSDGVQMLVHPALEAEIAQKLESCEHKKYAGKLSALRRAEGKSDGNSS